MSQRRSGSPAPAPESAGEGEILGVVPCYNVGGACAPVLEALKGYLGHILAVDDGSSDDTRQHMERAGVEVLSLPVNGGKGGALLAAFREALHRGYAAVLTLDGDGQHDSADIPALLHAFAAGNELVVGRRDVHRTSAPLRNWIGNALSARLFALISGTAIGDCQSGFRVYSAPLLRQALTQVRPGRYETEMELLLFATQRGFPMATVPIRTVYNEQSRRLSHFHPVRDTARVLFTMARGIRIGRRHVSP